MVQIVAVLVEWLPKLSIWALLPAALLLLALTCVAPLRFHAAVGLLVVAGISLLFLAIGMVAIIVSYAGSIGRVFRDFGLIETVNLLATLIAPIGTQLAGLLPALMTAIISGVAALMFRGVYRRPPAASAA